MTYAVFRRARSDRDLAMSDILSEQLSALLDGELPPEQTTLLLKRLGREPELARRLTRFRLCGDVLRGERVRLRADFAMRISAAIATEAPLPAAVRTMRRPGAPRWLSPLTGLAVAASVAIVAVLLLKQSPQLDAAQPLAATAVAPTAAPVARVARGARSAAAFGQDSGEPESYVTPIARPHLGTIPEGMLANYVVAHSQFSAPLAGRSVLIHLVADESRGDAPAR
jgi:sigma-E factor negative regulatory protein RseA